MAEEVSKKPKSKYHEIIRRYVYKYPSYLWVSVDREEGSENKSIKITRGIPDNDYWEHLRIRNFKYWKKIKEIIEGEFLSKVGWDKSSVQIDLLSIAYDQVRHLQSELSKQVNSKTKNKVKEEELLRRLGEKELQLAKTSEELEKYKLIATKNKYKQLKSKLPELKKKIEELKRKVKDPKLKEQDYHQFLKENPWFFGPWYTEVISKPKPSAKDCPDFQLKRYDGFHDIVEIESANDPLFASRSNRLKLSGNLKDAMSEIMDYIDVYIKKTMEIFYEEQRELYKPKGIVIIGKRKESERRELKQLNSFLHDIEILTFDDLIDRAEKIIEFLKDK